MSIAKKKFLFVWPLNFRKVAVDHWQSARGRGFAVPGPGNTEFQQTNNGYFLLVLPAVIKLGRQLNFPSIQIIISIRKLEALSKVIVLSSKIAIRKKLTFYVARAHMSSQTVIVQNRFSPFYQYSFTELPVPSEKRLSTPVTHIQYRCHQIKSQCTDTVISWHTVAIRYHAMRYELLT